MNGSQEWRDRRSALYVNATSSHQNQKGKGGEKMARKYQIKYNVTHWDTRNLKLRDKKSNLFVWTIKLYYPENVVIDDKTIIERFKRIGQMAKKMGWKPDRPLSLNSIRFKGRVVGGTIYSRLFQFGVEEGAC